MDHFFFVDIVSDFEEPEYSVPENGSFVEVCVFIVDGILERNLTMTLSTIDQTAVGTPMTTYDIISRTTLDYFVSPWALKLKRALLH